MLTPFAARLSVYMLIILRVLEGIGEGVTFPSMHALLSRWIPPVERSRAVTFIYAGCPLGTVIGMSLSGILCDHGFAGGWPSVFFVFGTAGCVWCFMWFILCRNSPSSHPSISEVERRYIEISLESRETSTKPPVPWTKIAMSPPLWACAAAHFASNWGSHTLLTCLPKYMRDVLQFDMTQNGILSGLPYMAAWLLMTVGGLFADWLSAPHRLQTGTVRKLFCGIGSVTPALFLIAIGFLGCNRVLIVTVVIIAVGASSLSVSGFAVNHLDLAPAYAGTLMGLTNTLATVPGFVGPQVVGVLTYNQSTRGQWQKVFYIASAIYGFGAAVFLFFGSGKLQDWAVMPRITADDRVVYDVRRSSEREVRDAPEVDRRGL